MAREELAPGVVGGLLVSYRLEGRLKDASSIGGGTTSGCGSLGMEPWTKVSLGALKRLDGDEDLAPRIFAMAILDKVVRGAHAALAQMGVRWKGALVWLLFGT